jgi:integrase
VSIFPHHGAWYLFFTLDGRAVRRRVSGGEAQAEVDASLMNARLVAAEAGIALPATTGESGHEVSRRLKVADLRQKFLEHHEHVLASSLATVSRYRAATKHLEDFTGAVCERLDVASFVQHLRHVEVAPNGHANTAKRRLREKGVLYILECCRAMFRFGARSGCLPAAQPNPFTDFGVGRLRVRDAKPVFVFSVEHEDAFFAAAGVWDFPIQATLAKTGIRRGELAHLLIEDLDLTGGWMDIRGKPELGWSVKTGRERRVPLVPELVSVLQHLVGDRAAGPVFLRERFDRHSPHALDGDRLSLSRLANERLKATAIEQGRTLSRREQATVLRSVWRDAGALDTDRVRTSFIKTARAAGVPQATCPKSWRHTFATLLQEANVDPLVRQETLGHRPPSAGTSALGMTGVYTHTSPSVQRREIERALQLRPRTLQRFETFSKGGSQ